MQTFPAAAPVRLVVTAPVANLAVRAGDAAEATVEVRPSDPGRSRDVKAAAETTVTGGNGEVVVTAPKTGALKKPGSIDVTVTLPLGSHVQGDVALGVLRTEGRLGTCVLASEVGQITVDAAETVDLRSTTGHITAGHVARGAKALTVTGNVRIDEVTAGEVEVEVTHGSASVGVSAGSSVETDLSMAMGRVRDNVHRVTGGEPVRVRIEVQIGEIHLHTAVSRTTGV
ncbi:hypothetical protein Afil01_63020 [Actinorhabdospora filicis]|uniref:Adhesin domain-containing protein n=1 Tax=Actinorhabdospora filicis TaxID=1785913 RepID=A0A9W6ST60_9ACTN|nr:hypothetical protein [Actinorhabdospora filicis]GLZ81495.1 hypothetical protein Afil01_63020 [Actinorhabdospora filicis]